MATQQPKIIKDAGKLDGEKSPVGKPPHGIPTPGSSDKSVKNPVLSNPNPLTDGKLAGSGE